MSPIRFTFAMMLGLLLVAGCGRSAAPPKAAKPMSPEEAALDIVTAIYTISAQVKPTPPQSWDDLEAYASDLQGPTRKNALAAIEKIKGLNYQVTWGIDKSAIEAQQANASEFVIIESPDGKLKSTFGGVILRADSTDDSTRDTEVGSDNSSEIDSDEEKPDEAVFEPNRKKTNKTE